MELFYKCGCEHRMHKVCPSCYINRLEDQLKRAREKIAVTRSLNPLARSIKELEIILNEEN